MICTLTKIQLSSLQVQQLDRISRGRKTYNKIHLKPEGFQGLKKIEKKGKKLLIEKIIHSADNESPYLISVEKKNKN